MCDFKPGDEVVVVRSNHGREGMRCTVLAVCRQGEVPPVLRGALQGRRLAPLHPSPGLVQVEEVEWMEGLSEEGKWQWGYSAECFRKVQRRKTNLSIESFLTIKPDQFEEPRKTPEKTKEKA